MDATWKQSDSLYKLSPLYLLTAEERVDVHGILLPLGLQRSSTAG